MAATETRAVLRGVRLSVDKGRLVADLIRGKKVDQALNILNFTQKKAAVIVKKVLESAIANAEHNDGADIDELRVKTIYVEQGMTLKRSAAARAAPPVDVIRCPSPACRRRATRPVRTKRRTNTSSAAGRSKF